MKMPSLKMPPLQKLTVPAVAVAIGLLVGFGLGQLQLHKEQKIWQDKVRERDKKISFIQKKLTEEKAEATGWLEQKCRDDATKLETALQGEKKRASSLQVQVASLNDQVQKQDAKIRATEDSAAKTRQELQEAQRANKDLDRELKKTAGEKQSAQTELKRTTREPGPCRSNNAELAMMAQELVKKYKEKGVSAAILEKEPLTQMKKVEMEQLVSEYQEEIEQKKLTKK